MCVVVVVVVSGSRRRSRSSSSRNNRISSDLSSRGSSRSNDKNSGRKVVVRGSQSGIPPMMVRLYGDTHGRTAMYAYRACLSGRNADTTTSMHGDTGILGQVHG